MGGALLQKVNRDTLEFAYKCSAIVVDGELRDVYKQPMTDAAKTSKRGRLDLIKDNDEFKTVRLTDTETISATGSMLKTFFENGEVLINDSFDAIRNRAKSNL